MNYSRGVSFILLVQTLIGSLDAFQSPSTPFTITHRQTGTSGSSSSSSGSSSGSSSSSSFSASALLLKQHSQNEDSIEDEASVTNSNDNDSSSSSNNKNKNNNNRRSFLSSTTAAILTSLSSSLVIPSNNIALAATDATTITTTAAAAAATAITTPAFTKDLSWPLGKVAFSLLPLAATSTRRATVQECIIKDTIWTHDQLQGVVNVNVPVRQTVIKLSNEAGGGLLVYNPIAPTPQLIQMMTELEKDHGPIRHIILGTVALEHKATFGPFAQNYPNATVWLQPGQWAFPLSLPIELSGVTQRGSRLREIPTNNISKQYQYYANKNPIPEWDVDIGYETLGPLKFESVGSFSETALYHKPTKTLLVTDTVISVTDTPPLIIQEDPRGMLFHARDSISEVIEDNDYNRQKGWRRMVQFGLVFFPSQIEVVPFNQALKEASKIDKRMKPLGDGAVPYSLYPWTWHDNDADATNFNTISQNGEIFCPPILTKLILDREPKKTLDWVDRVCTRFDFERIIPCHLNNNVLATPKQFRKAFDVLANDSTSGKFTPQRPLAEDLALLQTASDLLTKFGVVGVSQICDGEEARVVGRFAKKN